MIFRHRFSIILPILVAAVLLTRAAIRAESKPSPLPTRAEQQKQTAQQTPSVQGSLATSESPLASQATTSDDKTAHAPEQPYCRWLFMLLWQFNWSNLAIVGVALWAAFTAKSTLAFDPEPSRYRETRPRDHQSRLPVLVRGAHHVPRISKCVR